MSAAPTSNTSLSGSRNELRFRGQFNINIDDKGRISIPAKFREVLTNLGEDTLVLAFGQGFLVAHPHSNWLEIEDEALALPQDDPVVQAYVRRIGLAVPCQPDRQGRILVPPTLRDKARLEREVVLSGALTRFELWRRDEWDRQESLDGDNFAEIQERVAHIKQSHGRGG